MVSSAINSPMQVASLFFDQSSCSCTAVWQSWTWSPQIFHSPFTLPCKPHYVYLRRPALTFELCTNISFYLVKATLMKSSLNQLTCISVWWELCDPTFIPLVMGLCALHSCKDICIFPRQQRALLIVIWLLYLSLPTVFPEERIKNNISR